MFYQTFGLNHTNEELNEDDIYITFAAEMELAEDIDGLIEMVTGRLLGGEISATLRTELAGMLARIPATSPELRAAEAIYLVVTSPEYAYQR
jgi:hypothetical protein